MNDFRCDGKLIQGFEGKIVKNIIYRGVYDSATIFFTDGTNISVDKISDLWEIEQTKTGEDDI